MNLEEAQANRRMERWEDGGNVEFGARTYIHVFNIIAPMRGDREIESIRVSNISEPYPAIVFSPRCEVLVQYRNIYISIFSLWQAVRLYVTYIRRPRFQWTVEALPHNNFTAFL
jgi:hypothetical protein